ncbi:MAG: methylated-DNA--[protein]-cysteine S-methyltransferase [Planctomycetaceae bacterium]|nr:methylated-DNA--[protein]-cysteine S-methyltransferase [Planctomycetaceae bacterium]
MNYYTTIESPLGPLVALSDGSFLTGLYLPQHKGWNGPDKAWVRSEAPFSAVRDQLAEYFAGSRQEFDISLSSEGTSFQRQVWRELQRIPFGTTITYAELARRIGQPGASRAVGNANGRNPISILVPCHRVVGADGRLTGYAGGVEKKRWLLAFERGEQVAAQREFFTATT